MTEPTDWGDDLEFPESAPDPRFTPEALRALAIRVQDAIRAEKEGPLPSWIKLGPRPKPKEDYRVR